MTKAKAKAKPAERYWMPLTVWVESDRAIEWRQLAEAEHREQSKWHHDGYCTKKGACDCKPFDEDAFSSWLWGQIIHAVDGGRFSEMNARIAAAMSDPRVLASLETAGAKSRAAAKRGKAHRKRRKATQHDQAQPQRRAHVRKEK